MGAAASVEDEVFARIDERLEADILRLQAFVRQPSISAENRGIRECADLLRGYLVALGCDPVEIVETGGHPVVYGERWVGAPNTLLIYLMYDTQPVSGEEWSVPPLEGRIVDYMRERTVSAFSFSKAYGMTAYRIGYSVGPAAFTDHLHSILRFSIQVCSAVGQRAAHAVLTNDMKPWLAESTANLQSKRDYLVDRLNAIPGIRCNTPRGVYFTFPDIRGLGLGSVELAEHILREGRVAVAPGSQFGPMGEGHLRVSFCPSIENIKEGMDRFERAVATIPAAISP